MKSEYLTGLVHNDGLVRGTLWPSFTSSVAFLYILLGPEKLLAVKRCRARDVWSIEGLLLRSAILLCEIKAFYVRIVYRARQTLKRKPVYCGRNKWQKCKHDSGQHGSHAIMMRDNGPNQLGLLIAQTIYELGSDAWPSVAKLLSKHPLLNHPNNSDTVQSCQAMYAQLMTDADLEMY